VSSGRVTEENLVSKEQKGEGTEMQGGSGKLPKEEVEFPIPSTQLSGTGPAHL